MHRRAFLRLTGAVLATAAFPPVVRKALAIPASSRHRSIMDVEHVVILMQENRAFDHYFGTLPGVRGYGDRITIPLPGGRSVWEQQEDDGTTVLPYHLDSATGNAQRVLGTPHFWGDAHAAWNKGATGQWPAYKFPWSMGYYEEQEVAFQFALARAFTVCDAYFCSIHSSTNPNRLFMFTGTNDPAGAGGGPVITNDHDSIGPPAEGYLWTTYPERLEAAGISWKVYQVSPTTSATTPWPASGNTASRTSLGTPSPLVQKGLSTTLTSPTMDELRADVLADTLPEVSWIVAPTAYSEHAGPSSPSRAPGTNSRCSRRSPPIPPCGARRCCSSCSTRTTASSTMCRRRVLPRSTPMGRSPAPARSMTPPSATSTGTCTDRDRASR